MQTGLWQPILDEVPYGPAETLRLFREFFAVSGDAMVGLLPTTLRPSSSPLLTDCAAE